MLTIGPYFVLGIASDPSDMYRRLGTNHYFPPFILTARDCEMLVEACYAPILLVTLALPPYSLAQACCFQCWTSGTRTAFRASLFTTQLTSPGSAPAPSQHRLHLASVRPSPSVLTFVGQCF